MRVVWRWLSATLPAAVLVAGCLGGAPAGTVQPAEPSPVLALPADWVWAWDVVRANETAVLLHWRATAGLGTTAAGVNPTVGTFADAYNHFFFVPDQLPLLLRANLTWGSSADLDLQVVKGEPEPIGYERRCVSEGGDRILGDDGHESCSYRLVLPLAAPETWNVFVQTRHNLDPNLKFDVYLEISVEDS